LLLVDVIGKMDRAEVTVLVEMLGIPGEELGDSRFNDAQGLSIQHQTEHDPTFHVFGSWDLVKSWSIR
jgi:hypothetical protein